MDPVSRARAFARREDGATAIEYGLIAALIAVIIIAAVSAMGPDKDTPLPGGGDAGPASTE